MLSVIDDDGRISARCGAPFAGMRRYDARTALIDALKQRGMYRGTEENAGMIVPICRW
jgi:valyl-tRNA synthetase